MGNLCFPNEGLSGDNGHTPKDVMYIAFKNGTIGTDGKPINTVPGASGAAWNAASPAAFENSIKPLCDKLVATL